MRAWHRQRWAPAHAVGALVLVVAATPGHAAPGDDPGVGAAVFTGATLPHPSSLVGNPAAMPLGQPGNHLAASGGLTLGVLRIDRAQIDVATGALRDGPSATPTTLSPAGALAYWSASRKFAFGIAVDAGPGDAFADSDGDAGSQAALRWTSTGGRYRASNLISAALGYGFTSSIYLGAAISYTRTHLEFGFDRDTALAGGRDGLASDCDGAPCGLENPAAAEHVELDATPANVFDNFVVTVGGIFQIRPRWWLAVAYRSAPRVNASLELTGDATITRAPRDGGEVLTGQTSVYVSLPSSVEVGLRGPIAPGVELITGARWEDLSRLDAFDVRLYGRAFEDAGVPEWLRRPRGYRDPLRVWAGVEQIDYGQRWLGGARLSVATPSVDRERVNASTIERWAVGLSLGGQARIGRGFSTQLTYTGRWFPGTTVDASAFNPIDQLDCIDSDYDFSTEACRQVRDGYAQPTAAGSYGRHDHTLRLGVRYDW